MMSNTNNLSSEVKVGERVQGYVMNRRDFLRICGVSGFYAYGGNSLGRLLGIASTNSNALEYSSSSSSIQSTPPILSNCEIRFTRLKYIESLENPAEPYLWPFFFKIDGQTLRRFVIRWDIDDLVEGFLVGKFEPAEGETTFVETWPPIGRAGIYGHGDIGSGMLEGESRILDPEITTDNGIRMFRKRWGDLIPIPVYMQATIGSDKEPEFTGEYVSGMMGCVAVLMEEDEEPSNNAIVEGYKILIESMTDGLNNLIRDYSLDFIEYSEAVANGENPEMLPQEDIDTLKSDVKAKVKATIKDEFIAEASGWDLFMEWIDDNIGFSTGANFDDNNGTADWLWTTEDLMEGPSVKEFNKQLEYSFTLGSTSTSTTYRQTFQIFVEVQAERLLPELDPAQVSKGISGIRDQFDCFIATAAYGSDKHNAVNVLRNWRDKKLAKSRIGLWLVEKYYELSPPLARLVSRSRMLRWLVRTTIFPITYLVNRYHPDWGEYYPA